MSTDNEEHIACTGKLNNLNIIRRALKKKLMFVLVVERRAVI